MSGGKELTTVPPLARALNEVGTLIVNVVVEGTVATAYEAL
jgi:precorrin-6B methylase 2